jgi:hypothetical protein
MAVALSQPKTSFGYYLVNTLLHPRQTFDQLLHDERRLKFGFYAMLVTALTYNLVYIFLTIGGGAPSAFEPWLAVPKDVYYFYNRFWIAPSMFACWILAAGVAHLLSYLVSGKGSFEDTLSVLGFGITIASFFSALHDVTDSFLGAIGLLDLRWYEIALNTPTIWRTIWGILYGIAIVLLFVLTILGVAHAEKIKLRHALWIGFIAAILYQGMFLVFNR